VGELPVASLVRDILKWAVSEADQEGAAEITTGHLLLGVLEIVGWPDHSDADGLRLQVAKISSRFRDGENSGGSNDS